MDKDNKTKMIIIITTIILLISVIVIGIILYISNKKKDKEFDVTFKQLYVTEYNLIHLVDNYFYENGQDEKYIIDVTKQKEVLVNNFNYEKIYNTNNGNYILYNNDNNSFTCYLFDGEKIEELYHIDNKSLLPLLITKEEKTYIFGFYAITDDGLQLYNLYSNDFKVIPNITSIIVTDEEYFIVENKDHRYGVIKNDGTTIINPLYLNVEITDDRKFILKNNKNLYGILDDKQNPVMTFKYSYITKEEDYYLIAQNDKLSLYDNDLNTIIDSKMNYNVANPTDNLELIKFNNNIYIINNKDEGLKEYKYNYHTMYIVNNKKIKEEINENDVFYDGKNIYYIDKNKLNIINQKNEKKQLKVDNRVINAVQKANGLYELTYIKDKENTFKRYYNEQLEELTFENEIIYIKEKALGYIENDKNNEAFKIVDESNNLIKDIKGKQIYLYSDYLIVDNAIYKIIIK